MECIGKIMRMPDGHVFVADNDGNELNVVQHVGQSLYVGDYDALLKELHELRKDKARLDFMVEENNIVQVVGANNKICYSILGVESRYVVGRYKHDEENIYDSPRAAIDAAIAKSEKQKGDSK
jgi:hypothetical protein